MASELIERELYNGTVHLVHNPHARGSQPRYVVESGDVTSKPSGVTTILGDTISKDLMKWAVDCMADYLSEKLDHGITAEDIEAATSEYVRRRDSGAGTGTETHALVEQFLKLVASGRHAVTTAPPTASPEAAKAYEAFTGWFRKTEPEVVNVEEVIYSQEFEYAGTYDCMLRIDGKNYLCDLKTTNAGRKAPKGVYAEMFLQLGAYAAAHREQREYELANGGTNLVPIDDLMVISAKKNGQLDIVTASELGLDLELCESLYQAVVTIWRFLKGTTKLLGGK